MTNQVTSVFIAVTTFVVFMMFGAYRDVRAERLRRARIAAAEDEYQRRVAWKLNRETNWGD